MLKNAKLLMTDTDGMMLCGGRSNGSNIGQHRPTWAQQLKKIDCEELEMPVRCGSYVHFYALMTHTNLLNLP